VRRRDRQLIEAQCRYLAAHVAPHTQTNPNNTQRDNSSAVGNVNPYSGAVGTRNPPLLSGVAAGFGTEAPALE